ncbi:MAG: Clp protease ClpP [Desulfuromonadaceae bacterium]|nr:Clp protease ClpP [Desulfuromonadaceae bacterium]
MPRFELNPQALASWNPSIKAAAAEQSNSITMYGVIGDSYSSYYGEGVTLSRVDAALRSIGDNEVDVYINSPGGDMFEGIAIYNRLREHPKKVTVKVIGLAASAASIIAMAGEDRLIAKSAFLMIHNCWSYFVGNRHELRSIADQLEEFDTSMRDVYIDTSGTPEKDIEEMMDREAYLSGRSSVDKSFMTGYLSADEITTEATPEDTQTNALKALDVALSKSGMPRSERRKLLADLKTSTETPSKPSAADNGMPSATVIPASSLDDQKQIMSSLLDWQA